MKTPFSALLTALETHSVTGIRSILATGFDVRQRVDGKTPINYLIEMYLRSDRFPECLQLLLQHGATLDDPKLEAVLLNNPVALESAVRQDANLLAHRTSLTCAFTPLIGASLLHVAAEYGHVAVVKKLLELGAEVDARAATDESGLNGQTPLFHVVNSNANRSAAVMNLLLDAGASPTILLLGITWGHGFDWETTCFDVTPISYAQLGILPQMHRSESDSYENIRALLRAAGRVVPSIPNVPNRYLRAR